MATILDIATPIRPVPPLLQALALLVALGTCPQWPAYPFAAPHAGAQTPAPAEPPRTDDRPPATPPDSAPSPRTSPPAGLRLIQSRHLSLVTDLPFHPEVDTLPQVFDQAVPQWADYFHIPPERLEMWHVTACVMVDADRFKAAGLLPSDLPDFPHAFQRGDSIWVYDQPSDYYRRHLLLHEGTHAVMQQIVGGTGPPWFMEGMAELLATHHWHDQRLQLRYMPASREEAPLWGRIGILRNEMRDGQPLALEQVMAFGPTAHQRVEPYGWCWGICLLLDQHPRFRERFAKLIQVSAWNEQDFNQYARTLYQDDWDQIRFAWQAFLEDVDYGYSVAEAAVIPVPVRATRPDTRQITIAANRSWQDCGIRLRAGRTYQLNAEGEFVIARDQGQDWIAQPQGVTIEYYRGRPLGELTAALMPVAMPQASWRRFEVHPVGRQASLRPTTDCILLLRINEMPGRLADNQGEIEVTVRAEGA